MITQSRLLELFDYQDGQLIWKINRRGHTKKNDVAGHLRKNGYVTIKIDKKDYLAHRLIFMWHTGSMPDYIDHIDRNPSNNKIENLRKAIPTENQGNRNLNNNNKSGYRGVVWSKKANKWQAQISNKKKTIFLGYFDTAEKAYESYCKQAKSQFGEFANL